MQNVDLDKLLEMLSDPHVESLEIARFAGVPREEAGRAARLLSILAKVKAEEVASLPGPLGVALCRAASASGRVDLLGALATQAEKEIAKEAKRALHVLRTRGVAVPELPQPKPVAARPSPPEPPLPAYVSAPDPEGERAVWTCRNVPGKGVEIGQAVLSDTRGLVEFQAGVVGRKEWRSFVASLLEKGSSVAVAEIPFPSAHALLAEARAMNDRTGERIPEGAELFLTRLGPAPTAPDPAEGFEPLAEGEEEKALEASARLHDLPIFRGWLADIGELEALATKLAEAAVSSLYIDENQRQEHMEGLIADAAETFLTRERRALLARRLYVVAHHLVGQGDEENARRAAAVARALLREVPARSIPFARLLVEKAFPDSERGSLRAPGLLGARPKDESRIDPPSLLR